MIKSIFCFSNLVSQKRYQEADRILRRAANANKMHLPDEWWNILEETSETEPVIKHKPREYNFFDLFKTPTLRKISLTMMLCWSVIWTKFCIRTRNHQSQNHQSSNLKFKSNKSKLPFYNQSFIFIIGELFLLFVEFY